MGSRSSVHYERVPLLHLPYGRNEAELAPAAFAAVRVSLRCRGWQASNLPAPERAQTEKLKRKSAFDLCLLKEDSRQLQSAGLEALREAGTNTSWTKAANHLSLSINPCAFKLEYLLHSDRLAFHSGNFRNSGKSPRSVRKTRHLDHQVNGGGDLLAHGAVRQTHSRHLNHRLKPRQRIAWG